MSTDAPAVTFSDQRYTRTEATPDERRLYEEAESRYFTDKPFHDRVNVAADIAMRLDAIPGLSNLKCRTYYRTSAAVALVLAEKELP